MAIQNEPTRITIPFADSGTKNSIPDTQPSPSASQAASWTDGFPAQCSLPLSAGGIPPARADFNGIFNRITQSERFTQEGGVWLWSNAVDYAANRMVRGSDGRLYWSVGQSGPGFASGAVDPTTDDGSYWSSPALKTMPLGDKSAKGATTEWVKDLAVAPVYVAPGGDDSKDGLTPLTAVATITRAISIGKTLPQDTIQIIISGGTYIDSSIVFSGVFCEIQLEGNVEITSSATGLDITSGSTVVINGGYDVTITSDNTGISVSDSSFIANNSSIHIVSNSRCFFSRSSKIKTSCSISATDNGGSNNIELQQSNCEFQNNITINGTKYDYGLLLSANTVCIVNGTLSINSDATNTTGAYAQMHILHGSLGEFFGYVNVVGTANSPCTVNIGNSKAVFLSGATFASSTSSTDILICADAAICSFEGGLTIGGSGGRRAINLQANSEIIVRSYLTAGGTFSQCFLYCAINSIYIMPSSVTVTNYASGSRYYVSFGGLVYVEGVGPNALPGDSNGTVVSNSYGYYG